MSPPDAPAIKGIAALNVYKKVALIRKPDDSLTYEGADGTIKTIKDLGQAVASQTTPTLQPNRKKHDIPVPRISNVETYDKDVPSTYDVPISFVRYHRMNDEEIRNSVEYVIDAEDQMWLQDNAKFGEKAVDNHREKTNNDDVATMNQSNNLLPRRSRRPQISLDHLEQMLDIVEKATGFETIITKDRAETLILQKIPELKQIFPSKVLSGDIPSLKGVIHDVYQYWVQKRSKLKRPLLRRYWPVTATDDTNPHLVFRPREKEKYKLRRKRQDDIEGYRKLKQLRSDFERVKSLMALVMRREELNKQLMNIQADWMEQKLYDMIDTSNLPRESERLTRTELEELEHVPQFGDPVVPVGGKRKRQRLEAGTYSIETGAHLSSSTATSSKAMGASGEATGDRVGDLIQNVVVAGQNGGEPAPHYLQPLSSRETNFTTSWDHAVPYIPSYVDARPTPTFVYRHRPRVGRGGRIMIDRFPQPIPPSSDSGGADPPLMVYTAGHKLRRPQKRRLLELLPKPLDHAALSSKIEEMCAISLKEDQEQQQAYAGAPGLATVIDPDEIEEVLVPLEDYLDTDDPVWGEEKYAIGPI